MASKQVKSKDYVDSSDDSEVEPISKVDKRKRKVAQTKNPAKPSKKAKKDSNSEDESSSVNSWPLSAKRNVTISEFRGQMMVDIREFYLNDSGEQKPGKKGISLSIEQWEKLKEVIPVIDAKLAV
ncbi:Activated RNA polymerase II transcriptional coactivator p15-like [Oopsacas minuta]|uniref:Activated RNA polymerase II transcriptional coactivator p15-like n=1 Tax=Oopsacas minuta TaxID=111878 RepID=A0AAV7JLA6_9METZ|nr:Activated RNA polymerase II transcriptional coactivator p15-like [Oopsacas minuta]